MPDMIGDAEREIEAILKRLELATGSVVRDVTLDDLEITQISDDRKKILRHVVIKMERLPGTEWAA